ncbi:MAG TPA: SIMPL domain-containing protein [Acidimicrobiales bacterium]|nr:SIMPL domain-containing protein [Acidimicrobiales bacterium]
MVTKGAFALGAVLAGAVGVAAYGGTGNLGGPNHPRASLSASVTQQCQTGTPTVTVSGDGTATGAPNQVVISLGAQTQAVTAGAAMTKNDQEASALVAKLQADGVAKADLQTSNLSVQPNYNSNGTVITSYQVTDDISVTLHNISLAGRIIDDAAGVAGNDFRLDGVTFSVQDQSALLAQARSAAVHQAADQAQAMAGAAGQSLGPLCSLTDNTSVQQPQPLYAAGAPAASAATTPVEAGLLQVTANVTAVYELSAASGATTASAINVRRQ